MHPIEAFEPDGSLPVAHFVQTNATRIDAEWCELFAQFPVRVSVSIDGTGEANATRKDWAGNPSTTRALDGIGMLRGAGIGFSLVAVVADLSPGAASRLYEFTCELGCESLGANLAERKGVYDGGHVSDDRTVAFWRELATVWQADPRIRVRDLDHAYAYIREELAGDAPWRATRPIRPLSMITWEGYYLPFGGELAGFHSPRHGPFTVGNVLDTPLTTLAASAPNVPWVAEALEGIANCRQQCEYFAYCRGGQPANKYFETGRLDTTETDYCRTSKINLLEGILSATRDGAASWQARQLTSVSLCDHQS